MPTGEATMVHLSDEQRQALQQTGEREPVPVYDARNGVTYYLLPGPLYERVRGQLEEPGEGRLPEIPPGIRRSKEAFLRDLPELMASWWDRGKWAGYHGEKRLALCRQKSQVLREFKRQGIPNDQYYVGLIRHHEPEPEEIDPSSAGFPD